MTICVRRYAGPADYWRVDDFLRAHYQPQNRDGHWLAPIWEDMHGHPYLEAAALERIGIGEAEGQIVAVANYESRLGEAFFQFHPAYRRLREALLDHAEQTLAGPPEADGRRVLRAFVSENDEAFLSVVRARG